LIRIPLHSITIPSSDMKTWEGSVRLNFDYYMGEASEGDFFCSYYLHELRFPIYSNL
jgi:hypothetical protein